MHGQRVLDAEQLLEFDHTGFVNDQIRDFRQIMREDRGLVDIGGGAGWFAEAMDARVVDLDKRAVERCRDRGIRASVGDALDCEREPEDQVVCFNLVLHHLVSTSEPKTRSLQIRALSQWRDRGVAVFVNEYIYESYLPGFSARLIYAITSSKLLSKVAGFVGIFVRSLRANTLGIGVRFRDNAGWHKLFTEAGFAVSQETVGWSERVPLPLRLMMVRSIHRNSYRLEAMPES